jgi:hypothetical protein
MLDSAASVGAADRRVHTRVREIFEDAMRCVRPFFDRVSLWSDVPLAHFAYRALRDRYPDLTFAEIYVFVGAAARIYAAGGEPGKRHRCPPP